MRRRGVAAGLAALVALLGLSTVFWSTSTPVVATVSVGAYPLWPSIDQQVGHLFVPNYWDTTVDMVAADSGQVLRTVTVGSNGGAHPIDVVVDARRNRALVCTDDGRVSVLDARTGAVLGMSMVGTSPQAMAVDERSGRAFVTTYDSNTVRMLDSSTGALLRTIPVGMSPLGIDVDEAINRVFVANGGDNTVSMLNASSGALVRSLRIGSTPTGIRAAPSLGLVFVASAGNGSLSAFDAQSGTTRYTIGPIQNAQKTGTHVAIDEHRGHLFVANGTKVQMLDARTGTRLRVLTFSDGVLAMADDPVRGRVLVTTTGGLDVWGHYRGAGNLIVLDARTGSMRRTLPVGVGPSTILVDTAQARAVVVNTNVNLDGSAAYVEPQQPGWERTFRWVLDRLPWHPSTVRARPLSHGTLTLINLKQL